MAAYDYLNQSMVSTTLIQSRDNDSFFNPDTLNHNGFGFDGVFYTNGVPNPAKTSLWFRELPGSFRGTTQAFPQNGLILLSRVALTILEETATGLNLWMQFILADDYALANNFNGSLNGFLPTAVVYADGVVSVTSRPDAGSVTVDSNMIVTIDFVQDQVFLDVAV